MEDRFNLMASVAMMAALSACATTPSSTASEKPKEASAAATANAPASDLKSRMVGMWNGQINGAPMDLEYTDSAIKIPAYAMELPYELTGDVLTVEVMGQKQKSRVSFSSDGDMVQTNLDTGDVVTMKRKN